MRDLTNTLNINELSKAYRPLLVATIFLSIVMVTLGGVVHNTDSSLACPDWPLCFVQVMPEMTGGVAIEHSHRLLGTVIGLLVIALCMASWRSPAFRSRSFVALGLVILQGILGGVTVLLQISPLVSTLHLGLSQIFVAWLLWIWVDASPASRLAVDPESYVALHKKYALIRVATVALFFQMMLGASMRHGGAGTACGVGPEASIFCLDHVSGAVSFWPTSLAAKVNLLHRLFALVVTGLIIAATIPVIKFAKRSGVKALRIACIVSHALVCLQVGLGVASLWTGIGPVSVTLHLLVACLLWLVMVGIFRYVQNTFDPTFTIAQVHSKRI